MYGFARVTFVMAMFLAASTAATVALGDSAMLTATGDTLIYEGAGPDNWGASDLLVASIWGGEHEPSILRFDVGSLGLPGNQVNPALQVSSVTLQLTVEQAKPTTFNPIIYAISSANAGWVEGNGTGGAVTGAACWDDKAYNASSLLATPWAGSAGLSTPGADLTTPGTDYVSTPLASATVVKPGVGTQITFTFDNWTSAQLTTLINSWVTGGALNAGLKLYDANSDYQLVLYSREDGTTDNQPLLTINYTVPEPNTLILLASGLLGLLAYAWRKRRA